MSRQTARSEAKREAIIATATRVFLAGGYAAASMDGIATEADVSKRTVYNHFPTKRDLFRAVVGRLYESLIEADSGVPSEHLPPQQGLPKFAVRLLAYLRRAEVQALLRLVIAEHHRFPELSQDFFAGGKGPAVAMLVRYLAVQASQGRLAIPDPARAAAEFLGAVKEGCFWPAMLGLPTDDDDAVIASAVAAFLRAHGTDRP